MMKIKFQFRVVWRCWMIGGGAPGFGGWVVALGPMRFLLFVRRRPRIGDGLLEYDLERGANFLAPILTPLRNEIPRVTGKGGIRAHYRAVKEQMVKPTAADYVSAYKATGLEDEVTEAEYVEEGKRDAPTIDDYKDALSKAFKKPEDDT